MDISCFGRGDAFDKCALCLLRDPNISSNSTAVANNISRLKSFLCTSFIPGRIFFFYHFKILLDCFLFLLKYHHASKPILFMMYSNCPVTRKWLHTSISSRNPDAKWNEKFLDENSIKGSVNHKACNGKVDIMQSGR